jgi:hypothetical protein
MQNMDIRSKVRESRVYFWEIADVMGITPETLSRSLRHELPEEKKQEIYTAIEKILIERGVKYV